MELAIELWVDPVSEKMESCDDDAEEVTEDGY